MCSQVEEVLVKGGLSCSCLVHLGPFLKSHPLTRERDSNVHLPSCGEDTHSVTLGGKLWSVCTESGVKFIAFRQMI